MFKSIYAKVVGTSSAATLVLSLSTAAFAAIETLPSSTLYGFPTISAALTGVMGLVFFFALILVLIYLVWGGIQWITSGGDKAGTEAARGKITGAIVGIIIVAVAFAIYRLLVGFIPGADGITIGTT
ncbi:MAG: hypothetical protein M3Q44_01105 [bacterium]|nr:hypothetical protein [bacterium]